VSSVPVSRPNPLPSVALVAFGGLALLAGVIAGGSAAAVGATVFVLATLVAYGQNTRAIVTWPNALLVFVGVLWFIPIKLYSLPVSLPFELELYRLLILLLAGAFVVSSIATKRPIEAYSASKPLFVLAAAALASQIVNARATDAAGDNQALKSLSLLLSLIVVFLLVASTLDRFRDIERIAAALVIGGIVVAVAALYEGRTTYNVFNHLGDWIPLFDKNEREILELRGGRLRVQASSQHPIALGAAFVMLMPFALYFAAKARTRWTRVAWVLGLVFIVGGTAATVSRTTVAMGIVMGVIAFFIRRQAVVKLLPLLLVLPLFVHSAAPGAIGGLVKSLRGEGGDSLISSLNARAGEPGSGRLADVGPAYDLWSQSPIVGIGVDDPHLGISGGDALPTTAGGEPVVPIIFDNQYLHTIVALGLLGIIGMVWFVWGTARQLLRSARTTTGPPGDFIAACGIACAGYGAGMLFYDSLAFIQVTLLLFVFAALGLRTRALIARSATPPTSPDDQPAPAGG
jgi:hypothetical protein